MRKKTIVLSAAFTALLFLALTAAFLVAQASAEGDPAAGKKKAAVCAACHGAEGISMNPLWPNLAGQKDRYIVNQLKAFKEGTRKDPLMGPQSAGLSEADMSDLAAYFAALPCTR